MLKACPAHRKRWILLAIIVIVVDVVSNNISIIGKCVKCQTLPDACKFLINDYYDNNSYCYYCYYYLNKNGT